MGYSMGSLATFTIAMDERLVTTVHISGGNMAPERINNLRKPAAFICGIPGDASCGLLDTTCDIAGANCAIDFEGATTPVFYATFENFRVGVYQAESLLTGLGLRTPEGQPSSAKGPFNIELFAGSPDDNNASFFFNGAMSVLQPYIDKGVVKVASGQTDFKTVAILRWDPATAQKRMEDLLTSTYGGAKVDGVLSPYDGISIGILSALKSGGYGTAGQPYPIVTGQDAERAVRARQDDLVDLLVHDRALGRHDVQDDRPRNHAASTLPARSSTSSIPPAM